MMRRLVVVTALALALGACSNLGLGEADCSPPERDLSSANIITVQAVPTAKYTPCLNELRLGWDAVQWFARRGEAGLQIFDGTSPFLIAAVTASCDTSLATNVPSMYEDIERFEDVVWQPAEVAIMVIPSGDNALALALDQVAQTPTVQLDNRTARIFVDIDFESGATTRVQNALDKGQYVLIVDELGAEEGTVELRSNDPKVAGSRLSFEDALDEIEDHLPDIFYRGNWYFTFEGGCITYEFDARGTIAETVAADADDALGFYPAHLIRQIAEGAGYELVED